jgi:hypothetical protein
MKFLQLSLIFFLIQEELIIDYCKEVFGGCAKVATRCNTYVKLGITKCNACMKVAIASVMFVKWLLGLQMNENKEFWMKGVMKSSKRLTSY